MGDEELTLSDMLSDPIFLQLLASDRISHDEFCQFFMMEADRHGFQASISGLVLAGLETAVGLF